MFGTYSIAIRQSEPRGYLNIWYPLFMHRIITFFSLKSPAKNCCFQSAKMSCQNLFDYCCYYLCQEKSPVYVFRFTVNSDFRLLNENEKKKMMIKLIAKLCKRVPPEEKTKSQEYREVVWREIFGFIKGTGHTEDDTKHRWKHTERAFQTHREHRWG